MADTKVNLFPDLGTPLDDTKLAGQTPGGGASESAFQMALSVIRNFFASSGLLPGKVSTLTLPANTSGSVAAPANSVPSKIIIISTGNGTVNIGTSPNGSDLYAAEPFVNGSIILSNPDVHFTSAGNIYFSGHAVGITAKIIFNYV